jgi:hypothetical protein
VWGRGCTDDHVDILRSRRKEGHSANGGVMCVAGEWHSSSLSRIAFSRVSGGGKWSRQVLKGVFRCRRECWGAALAMSDACGVL